ncbi:hypothetical protein M5D96_001871 [Drosophila gunungcola]|uniref:Uncharacterized protein n=1 Tax=Drosophila gunungcola TaxID=103775 RepID=A0A9P9YZF0_9MUSC|nr:hypothetical protein M5D96_001871 [Drosophila gunungcola]
MTAATSFCSGNGNSNSNSNSNISISFPDFVNASVNVHGAAFLEEFSCSALLCSAQLSSALPDSQFSILQQRLLRQRQWQWQWQKRRPRRPSFVLRSSPQQVGGILDYVSAGTGQSANSGQMKCRSI